MDYEFSDLISQLKQWAGEAAVRQQLTRRHLQLIDQLDARSPDSLFAQSDERPLIVAFMGGTGVGKSSLINRLAEQQIARTGVERPTSREVTLYHHEDVAINRLPDALPLDKIRISRHHQVQNQHLIWVDMPDVDSIDADNRALVLEWLPHIDVLLYVVSPDRYRDNRAWQLLLAEGARHAWVFVMNHWDRGLPEQKTDFMRQLAKAGFDDPMVFCTDCLTQQNDEFDQLLAQLQTLSSRQTAQQLEQHNRRIRMQQIDKVIQHINDDLQQRDYALLNKVLEQQWQRTETMLREGMEWSIKQFARQQVDKSGVDVGKLWDDWAQSRLQDLINTLQLQADQMQIPANALCTANDALLAATENNVTCQAHLECRKALLNPGNKAQRIFLKTLKVLEFLLPVLAMSFVSYELITEFYENAQNREEYLGVDFAIHSVLLIVVTWLFPYFLHKKLQPSLEKAALQGAEKGVESALVNIRLELVQSLASLQQEHQTCFDRLQFFQQQTRQHMQEVKSGADNNELNRLVIEHENRL